MEAKKLILFAGVSGATAVIFGAFGAHALSAKLSEFQLSSVFETASRYHFYHTFALLACLFLKPFADENRLAYAVWAFISGTIIFSGSLYVMCLTNIRWLGAITPIGGLLLITGWVFLLISGLAKNKNA
jgi:uncharacterized membrane protein YgdD (TMEM256/DUF423 family)